MGIRTASGWTAAAIGLLMVAPAWTASAAPTPGDATTTVDTPPTTTVEPVVAAVSPETAVEPAPEPYVETAETTSTTSVPAYPLRPTPPTSSLPPPPYVAVPTVGPDVAVGFVDISQWRPLPAHEGWPELGMHRAAEHWWFTVAQTDLTPGTPVTLTFELGAGYSKLQFGQIAWKGLGPDDPVVDCAGPPVTRLEEDPTSPISWGTFVTGGQPVTWTCSWTANQPSVLTWFRLSAFVESAENAPAGPLQFTASVSAPGDIDASNDSFSTEVALTGRDIDNFVAETGFDGCVDPDAPCTTAPYYCGFDLRAICLPATGGTDDPSAPSTSTAISLPDVLPPTGGSAMLVFVAGLLVAGGATAARLSRRPGPSGR